MTHQLWNRENNQYSDEHWKNAKLEEVIAALFNPHPFIDPFDMQAIKKYHPDAEHKYKNLFYSDTNVSVINKLIG